MEKATPEMRKRIGESKKQREEDTRHRMGKAIHRKLGNEEALKKYGRSSFVFVGGTGLILEQVPDSNDAPDQEQVETDDDNSIPSGKKSSGR